MTDPTPSTVNPQDPKKPPILAQAAKAFSQLGLTCYVLLLVLALLATAGRDPRIAILMAVCAAVPLVLGPRTYRIIGLVALVIAGGFYNSAKPQPQRPAIVAPQQSPATTPTAPAAAPDKSAR